MRCQARVRLVAGTRRGRRKQAHLHIVMNCQHIFLENPYELPTVAHQLCHHFLAFECQHFSFPAFVFALKDNDSLATLRRLHHRQVLLLEFGRAAAGVLNSARITWASSVYKYTANRRVSHANEGMQERCVGGRWHSQDSSKVSSHTIDCVG
eukprot:m.771767 g.771767  ORF g.771767 m.771767 type:complete len:152 (-) comp23245_c0_seq6:153-608(-)